MITSSFSIKIEFILIPGTTPMPNVKSTHQPISPSHARSTEAEKENEKRNIISITYEIDFND